MVSFFLAPLPSDVNVKKTHKIIFTLPIMMILLPVNVKEAWYLFSKFMISKVIIDTYLNNR